MSSSETALDEVVDCAQLPACTCWMQTKPFTSGNLHLVRIAAIERSLLSPTCVSGKLRTVLVLVVVAAEGLAVDEGERGDNEDDAGRCQSDARGQPSTAFVAAERGGGTVDSDGADITREREKKFPNRPLLGLP